jgi:hypothetical protein
MELKVPNFLRKRTVFASEEGPDRAAAFTALSFFLRILAGHLFEAYEFLQKNVRIHELQSCSSRILDYYF